MTIRVAEQSEGQNRIKAGRRVMYKKIRTN